MATINYKDKYEKAVQAAMLAKQDTESAVTIRILEEIFPELKESDDESIRKRLLAWLKSTDGQTLPMDEYNAAIAWLEKQAQKPADKVEPKFNFKVGQWIVATGKCVYLVTKIDGFNVTLVDTNGDEYVFDVSSLDDAYQWTIQDANDGDVLATDDGICIFDGTLEEGKYPFAYCGITKRGFDSYDARLPFSHDNNIHPATKEQRDQLEKAMADAGYTFDFEKKELKKIEQNPAWSEEDTKALNRISSILVDASEVKNWWKDYRLIERDEMIRLTDFLKSLKNRVQPQNTWKPSDEQMDALYTYIYNPQYFSSPDPRMKLVESVYKDLKKLMEE